MDDFNLERQELAGTFLTLEFGPGGRIQQLWASDPTLPEENEEFQFVCPSMPMGDEVTEDYFPGTVLLGARTDPEEPWALSRNRVARVIEDDDLDSGSITFEYDFGFLEEIRATGRFSEIPGTIPQIAWDLEIHNRSRRSVEIGELGFPLALNNVYEGFPRTDHGTRELFHDRVYVHPFVGLSASYVFAERLCARPPGLLIFPGEETQWEFANHVPASLTTPLRWSGIPIVYAHSRGTIEREGWPEWFSRNSSVVMEPGETRTYRMRFASADRFAADNVHHALVACGRPAFRIFPGAVSPVDVGISVEVSGTTPTQFHTDVETEMETDADENGGFCGFRATEASPVRLTMIDVQDRASEAQLLLTEPIETLIRKRAEYIVAHQVVREPGPFLHAIVPANTEDGSALTDGEVFSTYMGVESGLSDALFLAQKNTIYPARDEIAAIDGYLSEFLEEKLLNPGDHSLGALLPNPDAVAAHAGRAGLYPVAFLLYEAMARVAEGYGETTHSAAEYRTRAAALAGAMVDHTDTAEGNGVPLMGLLRETLDRDAFAGVPGEARIGELLAAREREVGSRRYPFNGESNWNTNGFEESFTVARATKSPRQAERALRYAFAARSTAPSWWWYASDKRWNEEPEALPHPAMADKGELCLGPTTVLNSLLFLSTLDRDTNQIDELRLRLAFGGLLGVWALVNESGSAGMGFCPDPASRQFGMSWTTGDVGLGLYAYLRGVGSYVLPSRQAGVVAFGCHFEVESENGRESYVLRPWEGVGQRIVVRHVNLEVTVGNGRVTELRFDARKRHATLTLQNPSDKELLTSVRVAGLWGNRFTIDGRECEGEQGRLVSSVSVPAASTKQVEVKVRG